MMKHVHVVIVVLAVLGLTLTSHAEDATLFAMQTPSVSTNEYLYEIKDSEVLVNDQLITLFAFGTKGITVSYRNKTEKKMKPKYVVEVYNPYGMLLGYDKLGDTMISFGQSTYMEPGAVSSETVHLKKYPLDQILKHTRLTLPDDLLEMKWLVISETNTKKTIEPSPAPDK